jgi:hypothetical protein
LINKDDFTLWKQDPVTQAWFEACQLRVAEASEQLIGTNAEDVAFGAFIRGMIAAYREMTTFTVEDID